MAATRSPERDHAFEIYKEHQGNIDPISIAKQLNLPPGTVRGWKAKDKWESRLDKKPTKPRRNVPKRKRGGQPGNKNAVGSPTRFKPGAENANYRHSLFSKYMPKESLDIILQIESASPLDLLWDQIMIAYTAIQRAQQIMYVRDIDDKTINKIGQKDGDTSTEVRLEVQEAWDKQANFLKSQARAQSELRSMIKQYKEILNEHPELATQEQLARIEKLRADVTGIKQKQEKEELKAECSTYNGIPANMLAPAFTRAYFDICEHEHSEYVFTGGRGSTKSSFISLVTIDLLEKNPEIHAAVYRQVGDTLRDSVYAQLCWAIQTLGLEDAYKCTVSPMEITKKATGQKIFFRGCDDPMKSKGIKSPFGHIGVLWFEELDQYKGQEAVRTVTQSVIRGGDKCYIFKSFNPPKSSSNWANKYVKVPKQDMLVTESTYLDVPAKWLGKVFLDEAEFLKEVNPAAYEHEYMGVANGNGGNVFENVEIREITDQEINTFDRLYRGVDWGWYPDPFQYCCMYYDAARLTLYVFDEYRCNKKSNRETADVLLNEKHLSPNDKITCDSAEQKSIGDYKSFGLFARGAIKGAGSVEYGMKWLQSLNKIVIDNARCPETANEFLNYEYERDKEGNVISGYPDKDNHSIDCIRYAMEEVWRRKGQ